jgi:hypothetical protein
LIYHWNFKGRCIWRFRRGAKILRGGAKLSQGRCSPHLKIRPWKADLQCRELCQCENMESTELIVILIHETKGMECCARVSSFSWWESSTQRAAIKETMLQGWKKYRTTGPLVPEFFWVLRKYFPMQERKNCNNSHKRKIHTMTSEMQVQPS